MPKGFQGFQKGHPSFISKETYKSIGEKNSKTLKVLFKGRTTNTGRTHFKKGVSNNVGSNNPMWNGGKYKTQEGYIKIKQKAHPFADNQGYVLEHRLIIEKNIGRIINKNELVHHKNGIKSDNRISNLEIISRGVHTTLHCKGKKTGKFAHNRKHLPRPCKLCGKIIERPRRSTTYFCSKPCYIKSH